MTCTFTRHLKATLASQSRAIAPTLITEKLRQIGKRLRLGRQEDAHEFLRLLLDGFQRAELRLAGLKESSHRALVEATFVHNMFGGYFRNQLKYVNCACAAGLSGSHFSWCACRCPGCGFASNSYEAFLDVSVEVPKNDMKLLDLLGHFTVCDLLPLRAIARCLYSCHPRSQKAEVLDEQNKWRCDGCNCLVRARKKLSIHKVAVLSSVFVSVASESRSQVAVVRRLPLC